jgi:hypothetical protein
MKKLALLTATVVATAGIAVAPAAAGPNHRSTHSNKGNHCGKGHVKHSHRLGHTCDKRDRH